MITFNPLWLLQSRRLAVRIKSVPITLQHLLQIFLNVRPVAGFFTPGENFDCHR